MVLFLFLLAQANWAKVTWGCEASPKPRYLCEPIQESAMEDQTIKDRVQAQFGPAAQSYVHSAGHARGDDLRRLVELARLSGDERVLDIATGGGHTALAFAPHVREVVASDLTPQMLAAAEAFIREQG